MTTLTITPKIADKTARFKGAVAAGEHVAVTIKGGAEWIGTDNGANLTLRVLDLVTGRTLAVFPRPEETYVEDEEYVPDEWGTAGDDDEDLTCTLNLNTLRMVNAARHMLRVPVLFVLGDTDDPRTLHFRDRYEVEYWPERIGDTTPYDLDKWPKRIDEWAEQVAAWTSRMDNLALDAERVDGGVKITLNDGTLDEPKEVMVNDGEVSRNEMNAAIATMGATKQDTLTFDAIPTEGSDNPVKSGGVHGAVKEVADAVTEHVGNADIHVTAAQKTAWTAKYDKPQGGIPKSDLAQAVKDSLALADTAVQAHQDLSAYVNGAAYDPYGKSIDFKHDTTVLFSIDATAFIKDGMVDSVEISGGNLVISFNTDAGVEDIEIPLTDIFNPSNYYDKTAADGRFVQKETGKGLVAVDDELSTTSENPVQNKAVAEALGNKRGFTDLAVYELAWDGTDGAQTYRFTLMSESTNAVLWATSDDPATAVRLTWWEDDGGYWTLDVPEVGTGYLQKPGDALELELEVSGTTWNLTRGVEKTTDSLAKTSQIPNVTGKADKVAGATAGNLAALDAQGNLADSGVKPSDFAAKADIPYALVEPGKWEITPSTYNGEPLALEWREFVEGEYAWVLSAAMYGNEILGYDENSLALEGTYLGEVAITATRASLPGHLCDRAGNRVVVTGDTTLTLPAAVPGYLRDFLVRLEISGSTVPTITFAAPTGETLTYETDGDEFPVPDEAGNWLYSFTESCVAHKFVVSLKKVQTVAQGGA